MVSVAYNNIWKWIAVNWSTREVYYGADFNPTPFSVSTWNSANVVDATTNFDLSDFQPWHEVWCWVIRVDSSSDYSNKLYGDFERYDTTWHTSRSFYWDFSIAWAGYWYWYIYFWVDYDEIWAWYSKYRIHYYTMDNTINFYSPEFTWDNLSIDSTQHRAWDIRVEWSHICYIDWTWSWTPSNKKWFKHKIAFDSSYSVNVWWENAWHIWLDDSNVLQIYYVDQAWTKRRTYPSRERYWGNVNVWSSNKWYMRVSSSWDAEEWYAHLCFIAPNWSKRRILNWPPIWYS